MEQIYVTWRVFTYLETVPVAFVLLWESFQVQTVLNLSCFWELVIILLFFEIVPASLMSSWSIWSRTEGQNPRSNSWASEMYNWITTGSLYKNSKGDQSWCVLWKEWCWSWNSSTLATSCEELAHWKRLWCWEGLGAGGEGDDRGWDGRMAFMTWRTWIWVNSGSWWWTGKPGVLRFIGSQRVRHNWVTELNWTIMKKQKGTYQMKGQDKTPEKQLYEMEMGNFPEKEFRLMIVKITQDLGKTKEKMQEMFTKDLQELKNKQR